MADNKIIIGGATQPSTINTPSDNRERVATFEDIFSIDNPAIGGTVWVEDEEKEYRILSLKPKVIGGIEIENGAVNEVVPEADIISRFLTFEGQATENIASAIASNDEAVTSITEAIASNDEAVTSIADAISKKTEYDEENGKLILL